MGNFKKNNYMNNLKYLKRILIIIFIFYYNNVFGWGFFAHKKINRYAVFSLPKGMFKFYKYYIDFLEENSVNPDKRRYVIEGEACKHYIDMEFYANNIKNLPKYWVQVLQKYSKEFLNEHGTLPWTIQMEKIKLTNAFRNKDVKQILKISTDIGHYIADANVPLHTSKNYDGQLTNQKGIHAFWESRIPELFFDKFDLLVGKAEYIENTQQKIWEAIYYSHSLVNDLLEKDKELTKIFPSFLKYTFEEKNGILKKVITEEYCEKYNDLVEGQIEIQIRKSIKMVSDFWMTCWIDAGKPNLDELLNKNIKILSKIENDNNPKKFGYIREHEH